MQVLLLNLQAPLMSFGGPQVDQIGPTGRFPTVSQITGLLGNALGYTHREHDRLQSLQDRISLAAVLLRDGEELEDYQTVDLGQEHLSKPGWTTRGHVEHRAGGAEARFGTHIRVRRYRADAKVLAAMTLSSPETQPKIEQIADALDRPFRPLFLGRKHCLPADRIVFGLVSDARNLTDAISRAPIVFPDQWRTAFGATTMERVPAEWPIAREDAAQASGTHAHRVVDRRDWRNQLHGGERVVARGMLSLHTVERGEPAQ